MDEVKICYTCEHFWMPPEFKGLTTDIQWRHLSECRRYPPKTGFFNYGFPHTDWQSCCGEYKKRD